MMTIRIFRLLLCILTFWNNGLNGNNVEIIETGLSADDESFECGERLVLTCIITDFSQLMIWQNDSSITPLAQCALGVCQFDEQSEGIFEFTHNTSLAVFNLTILHTTFENDGAIYRCEDITTGDFSSSTIKVSDYLPITLEESADDITVTSGCIDPSVEVNIVWFKVKSDTGEESEYNPTTIVMPVIQVVCATENICSLSSYIQITTTIAINQEGNEAYKLKAVLFYDGERKESNITETVYMIKEQETTNGQTENTENGLIIGLSVGVSLSLIIVAAVVSYILYILYTKRDDNAVAEEQSNKQSKDGVSDNNDTSEDKNAKSGKSGHDKESSTTKDNNNKVVVMNEETDKDGGKFANKAEQAENKTTDSTNENVDGKQDTTASPRNDNNKGVVMDKETDKDGEKSANKPEQTENKTTDGTNENVDGKQNTTAFHH